LEKNEADMPITIMSWLNYTRLPRCFDGEISAM
jgi:hypothetical protein